MVRFNLRYSLIVYLHRLPVRKSQKAVKAALVNPPKAVIDFLNSLIVGYNKAQHKISEILVLWSSKALLVKRKKSLKPSWNLFYWQRHSIPLYFLQIIT